MLAALGYVANWRFVLDGASYGDLWSAPSPVQHFWSLAIEEQLYVVLPLGVWLVGARLRATAVLLTVALALSITAAVLVAGDQLRAYYGTDVRAAELLVGALLAVAVTARPDLGRRARALPVAAWVALGGVLLAWVTTSQTDGRLYAGGLHLHALAVALVIVAVRRDTSLARALSVSPLRWLGRVSYAAYLYHWPLFLWLTPARTGLDGVPLAGVRLGVSLGLAWVSTVIVEDPIRAGRALRTVAARTAYAAAAIAVVAAAVVVTDAAPRPARSPFDTAAPQRLVAPSTVLASSSPPPSLPPVETAAPIELAPGERLRVYVAGDSNAYILGHHLQVWSEGKPVDVWSSGWFGCPLVPGGEFRWADRTVETDASCNAWAERRAFEVSEIKPHIAVVISGSFDVLDRRLPGRDDWQHVGEPAYDALVEEQVATLTDLFRFGGARVLWAAYPHSRTGVIEGVVPSEPYPEWDPARMDRYNTLVRQVVAARPGAEMMELSRQMRLWPGGELDQDFRLDGIHPDPDVADDLAAWIGDQVLRLVARP